MSADETYEGWSNRETWAVALHINNDQGWQESVHDALREQHAHKMNPGEYVAATDAARAAGEIIRENVEQVLDDALTLALDKMWRNEPHDVLLGWYIARTERRP